MKDKIIAIIPARLKSTRLDEKLLIKIFNKSILQHTFENVKNTDVFDEIFIAVDDEKIVDVCKKINAKYILTSPSCPSGTARVLSALEISKELHDSSIVVNIQADHPKISKNTILKTIEILKNDKTAVCSTAATLIDYEKARSVNVVKVIFDKNNTAIYFSRSLIPFSKNKEKTPYYYHIGIYAYETKFLLNEYSKLHSNLQNLEELEQLLLIENGYKIKIAVVDDLPIGVDVKDDIIKIQQVLNT